MLQDLGSVINFKIIKSENIKHTRGGKIGGFIRNSFRTGQIGMGRRVIFFVFLIHFFKLLNITNAILFIKHFGICMHKKYTLSGFQLVATFLFDPLEMKHS